VLACISVTAAFGGAAAISKAHHTLSPFNPIPAFQTSLYQLSEGVRVATSPKKWLNEKLSQLQQASENIAASAKLPALAGTVDMIPSRQIEVIAAGLDYKPRPTVQEYATYSGDLIARNRSFFESDSAPDYLLFEPGSIDIRHPASAEGSLWPLFLQRYKSVDLAGSTLVLRKRQKPLAPLLGAPENGQATIGDWYPLPHTNDALFMKIDIRPTIIGKLLNFAFRPPQVTMSLAFGEGREEFFRLIPAQAREGMMLGPKIASSGDCLLVEQADRIDNLMRWPTGLRIDVGLFGRLAYSENVTISTHRVDRNALRSYREDHLASMSSRLADVWPLLANNGLNPPFVDLSAGGIFAHANSTLQLPTGMANRFQFSFGLRRADYASFPDFDGVCFTVSVQGNEATLFKRCLDPNQNPPDAEVQTANVAVPSDAILEIKALCRTTCNNDWSYWGSATLR
jgi:hypothetical protein